MSYMSNLRKDKAKREARKKLYPATDKAERIAMKKYVKEELKRLIARLNNAE